MKTEFTIDARFPDEESARLYLESRAWPKGATCPNCQSPARVITLGACATRKPGYYRCRSCSLDFTVRSATVMDRSKIALKKWVQGMHILTARETITSADLATDLGVSKKTAAFILDRLRQAQEETKC